MALKSGVSKTVALVLLTLSLMVAGAAAQTYASDGIQPGAPVVKGVDLTTMNASWNVPTVNKRGIGLDFTDSLVFNISTLYLIPNKWRVGNGYSPVFGRSADTKNKIGGKLNVTTISNKDCNNQTGHGGSKIFYSYTDSSGSAHEFTSGQGICADTNPGSQWQTTLTDGSGLTIYFSTVSGISTYIVAADGTTIWPHISDPYNTVSGAVLEQDVNGNLITTEIYGRMNVTSVAVDGNNTLTITGTNIVSSNLTPGQVVMLNGLTTASWLNDVEIEIISVTTTAITASFPHAAYGPAADTGYTMYYGGNCLVTNVAIVNDVLTITCPNTFSVGDYIFASSLLNATFLNQVYGLTVASASPTQFTANYTHANYGPTADSGIEVDENVSSSSGTIYTDTMGVQAETVLTTFQGKNAMGTVGYPTSTGFADIVINSSQHSLGSNFGCIYQGYHVPELSGFASLMDSIVLPDGSQYSITYESHTTGTVTGRMASVTYPNGRVVSYAYTGNNNGINCYTGTPVGLTVTDADGIWTFTQATVSQNLTTTVVGPAPANNTGVYSFVAGGWGGSYAFETVENQGSSTPLRTTTYSYNGLAVGTGFHFPVTRIDTYTTFAGTSVSTRSTQFFDNYGNTTETDVYTFGASTPSFKTIASSFGYTWNGSTSSPSCSASIGNGIMNKPCQVKKTDGSGNQLANSYFAYDTKGNLSSSATLVGSNYRVTTNTYNSNGTLATSTDPNNNETWMTYGACNTGLLTKVTLPNTLYTQTGWDSGCWGVPVSTTDVAGNTNSAEYNDPFYRITQSTDQASNSTNISYGYNPPSSESILNWGSSTKDIYTQSNPTALTAYRQVYDPVNSNWDTVESSTGYNSTGVVTSVTMPCATSKNSGCSNGVTTTTHDALGRPLVGTDGGGGTIANTYTASTSCTTGLSACFIKLTVLGPAPAGEVTKQVAQETDGLGRLVASCAISSATGSSSCGFGGYTGFLTTVAYNSTGTVASVTKGIQAHSNTYDGTGRVISSTTPESGTKQFFYDSAPSTPGVACSTLSLPTTNYAPFGNLLKTYDANGTTTCYSYDKLGRVVAIAYAGTNWDGYNKYFTYDSATVNSVVMANTAGHIAEAYTAATINGTKVTDEGFSYTVRGELSDVYQQSTNSGGWYHTTATYAANGAVLTLTGIPSNTPWTYTLDGKGTPVTAAISSTNMVTGVTYNAADQPCAVTLGLGDVDTYTYDGVTCTGLLTTGRISQYDFAIGATPKHFRGSLFWNANGTLNQQTIVDGVNSGAESEVCTYTNSSGVGYDEVGRLLGTQCLNGSTAVWGQNFTYDQYANLSKTVPTGQTGVTWTPTYNPANNQYSEATYDSNGNVLNDSFNTYTWNQDNKPTTLSTATHLLYDAFGRLVEYKASSTLYENMYSPIGMVARMSGQTVSEYRMPLPGGGTAVTGVYFGHPDHLGSMPVVSRRGNRNFFEGRLFAPYGESYNNTGTKLYDFTGDRQDLVAGVYDTPNRELTPISGRWASPDPAGASWNAYSYSTNPMGETDPSGLGPIQISPVNNPFFPTGGFVRQDDSFDSALRLLKGKEGRDIGGVWFGYDIFDILSYGSGYPLWDTPNDNNVDCREFNCAVRSHPFRIVGSANYLATLILPPDANNKAVCDLAAPLLKAARAIHGTVGVGAGGNLGLLFGFGGSLGSGAQLLADPTGNVGIAINVNPGFLGFGASAMGGGQVSVSTSQSIFGLKGWSLSGDVSVGAGPAFDLAVSKSFTVGSAQLGPTTGTLTVGPGIGTKAAVGSIGYTFVPQSLSTKCGG